MKCKACGYENANETGYCINCGAKLEPVQNPAQNPAHVYTQPVYAVQEKVPEAYKPISAWAYFGYRLLFCIPVIGFILLIVFSLLYFGLYDIPKFRGLQIYIMVTQFVAMAVYILYPTRQDLRPESFANDNFFTRVIGFMYVFDTNTGVCPSLHVAYSLGIASVWTKEKTAHPAWRVFVVFAVIMICLSTMFIKQHSAVDFFAAIPVCLIAEGFVYRDRYFRKKH